MPTIHLNGTSETDLLNELSKATYALRLAVAGVQNTAPNARDYYPQGAAAMSKAEAQHRARLQKIEDVRAELEKIAEHVSEQRDLRTDRKRS